MDARKQQNNQPKAPGILGANPKILICKTPQK
jgi:hypothetical protein